MFLHGVYARGRKIFHNQSFAIGNCWTKQLGVGEAELRNAIEKVVLRNSGRKQLAAEAERPPK
jgi:hypothetical protein